MKNDKNENTALSQTSVSKSVLLTDKCKIDFLEYYWKNYIGKTRFLNQKSETEDFFNSLYPTFKNALIIEFLDSIGIYIDSGYYAKKHLCSGIESPNLKIGFISLGTAFLDRNDAVSSAIIKANSLYNENVV